MGTAQTEWLDADYGAGTRAFLSLSVRPGLWVGLALAFAVAAAAVTL